MAPKRLVDLIEEDWFRPWQRQAQTVFPNRVWETSTDKELVDLIEMTRVGIPVLDDVAEDVARYHLLPKMESRVEWADQDVLDSFCSCLHPQKDEIEYYFHWLGNLLAIKAVEEFGIRCEKQMKVDGEAVSRFTAMNEDGAETYNSAIRLLIRRLDHHSWFPGDDQEAKNEIKGMAGSELYARVRKYHEPRARYDQYLRDCLNGEFNKVARRTREAVVEKLELLKKKELVKESIEDGRYDFSVQASDRSSLEVDLPIFLEQVYAVLSEDDRRFLDIYLHSQSSKEVAQKLGISSPRVSQRKRQIIDIIKDHIA